MIEDEMKSRGVGRNRFIAPIDPSAARSGAIK
jgi:hypothetical protein